MSTRHIVAALLGVALSAVGQARGADTDGDGVIDALDVCGNTPPGTAVDGDGRPIGDLDLDCSTDLADYTLLASLDPRLDEYAGFQRGFTGPLGEAVGACCKSDGTCQDVAHGLCAGIWRGAGTSCAEGACVDVVAIQTVTVGNAGNASDIHDEGYGAVAYAFDIGTYEVTAGQYCAFLNAVASDDAHELYNPEMMSSTYGCKIRRHGVPGAYTYSIPADWADRPVNLVSFADALRFANWLHNGQPTGPQGPQTTEDGSYALGGAMDEETLLTIERTTDATWVIPTEDEWYKAAYHKNDGVTDHYWDYATQSDTIPTCEPPPGTDMQNGSANYNCSGFVVGSPYYRNEVGAYDAMPSQGPYGTFDQNGNVWEWNEGRPHGSYRGLRGGSLYYGAYTLPADHRFHSNPTNQHFSFGFRVGRR